MPDVPGWPEVFRGSAALAAGLATRNVLYGPRFRRIYPNTYLAARLAPPDLRLRSLCAYRYTGEQGILAGYSAAEMLGASCGPGDAPAEVIVAYGASAGPPNSASVASASHRPRSSGSTGCGLRHRCAPPSISPAAAACWTA
jgi:hypothetical protein